MLEMIKKHKVITTFTIILAVLVIAGIAVGVLFNKSVEDNKNYYSIYGGFDKVQVVASKSEIPTTVGANGELEPITAVDGATYIPESGFSEGIINLNPPTVNLNNNNNAEQSQVNLLSNETVNIDLNSLEQKSNELYQIVLDTKFQNKSDKDIVVSGYEVDLDNLIDEAKKIKDDINPMNLLSTATKLEKYLIGDKFCVNDTTNTGYVVWANSNENVSDRDQYRQSIDQASKDSGPVVKAGEVSNLKCYISINKNVYNALQAFDLTIPVVLLDASSQSQVAEFANNAKNITSLASIKDFVNDWNIFADANYTSILFGSRFVK